MIFGPFSLSFAAFCFMLAHGAIPESMTSELGALAMCRRSLSFQGTPILSIHCNGVNQPVNQWSGLSQQFSICWFALQLGVNPLKTQHTGESSNRDDEFLNRSLWEGSLPLPP